MTRGSARRLAAVVLVAALGGCATTAGDGNVADGWSPMASATPKVPPSGVCYASSSPIHAGRVDPALDPIACTAPHALETFHVGQFRAEVALPPKLGEAEYWRTFEECERTAKDFLGDDWFNGRLFLTITVPPILQWEGGGRWYRCELIETQFMFSEEVVRRESSLAGALRDAAPLAQRCADMVGKRPDGNWDDLTPVDCAQPHDAEYAGSFRVPGTTRPNEQQLDPIFDGCWDVVAKYLGSTRGQIRVGYLAWSFGEEAWNKGDRHIRCYAAGGDRKMVGSVKGIGNAAPRSG